MSLHGAEVHELQASFQLLNKHNKNRLTLKRVHVKRERLNLNPLTSKESGNQ